MPVIRIYGSSETYETNLTTSILNALLKSSFPIQTVCGGRALCGRDLIRIRAGARFFSPMRERERLKLASLARDGEPSGPDIRLACQSYVRGDVEIDVIHLVDRSGQ
jgi:ferredoxin